MIAHCYVITFDGGGAPNFAKPATTLTVCKPRIRRKARVGDLVLAFNGKTLHPNPHSVRWAGLVSEVIPMEKYWEDDRFLTKRPEFSDTPDNFYRLENQRWVHVPNQTHPEPEYLKNDVWGQNALIFAKSWYFGDDAPELPEEIPLRVTARRSGLTREMNDGELAEIEAWLDAQDNASPRAAPQQTCLSCKR